MRILFICDRDICRGPMAVSLLKSKLDHSNADLRSAGISAVSGNAADPNAVAVLAERGIVLEHRAQPVTEELLIWAQLILTMTRAQKFSLISQLPDTAGKIYTFHAYVGHSIHDINPPKTNDLFEYRECLNVIESACDLLVQDIEEASA
ncbi:MAG: low molecular weight protein arginine phosphatase [Leptolyngbya sp. SIO4C1]|nr:low molecular weight protein arginine phosphatase [Leptolyngbya sp. SIO4C1]